MENINCGKIIERNYYVEKGSDFVRLNELISLMRNFAIGEITDEEHTDYFYDTPDQFLKKLNAIVRVREGKGYKILSIICNELTVRREFEMKMKPGDNLTDDNNYLLFLDDKLQDIYTHSIDVDIMRRLKQLKPFVYYTVDRKKYDIFDNNGWKCIVNFDKTDYFAKHNTHTDLIVEIKLNCYPNKDNEIKFDRFVRELEKKVVLIPMGEKKYDSALRTFNLEW